MSARVFSYVIEHDLGFAPNPFHGVCSLACCKPDIRHAARLGDLIMGTGAAKTGLGGRLVYWMVVDDIVTFDEYWSDSRFAAKRADMRALGRMHRYGDNIYHHDLATGLMVQEDSFHSRVDGILEPSNLKRDTGKTDKVLIGSMFGYYGMSAPPLPERFRDFVKKGPGHKCSFPAAIAAEFREWVFALPRRGYVDRPTHWQFQERKVGRKSSPKRRVGKAECASMLKASVASATELTGPTPPA